MENEELMEALNSETVENEEVVSAQMSEEAINSSVSSSATENRINDTTEIKVDSAMEEAKWYVLHTFSGYENVAKENLVICQCRKAPTHK